MKKIKNLMTEMSGEIKELGKRFPLTMLLIGFVTILFTVAIDQDFSSNTEKMLEKIYLFCTIWGVGTFFTENWFVERKNRMISYGLSGGISFIFAAVLSSDIDSSQINVTLRFLASYVCILILLSIYKSMKNAELKFEEYFLKCFRDGFNTTVTYIILNIGIVMITAIFVQLILDGVWRKRARKAIDLTIWFILCAIHGVCIFRHFEQRSQFFHQRFGVVCFVATYDDCNGDYLFVSCENSDFARYATKHDLSYFGRNFRGGVSRVEHGEQLCAGEEISGQNRENFTIFVCAIYFTRNLFDRH